MLISLFLDGTINITFRSMFVAWFKCHTCYAKYLKFCHLQLIVSWISWFLARTIRIGFRSKFASWLICHTCYVKYLKFCHLQLIFSQNGWSQIPSVAQKSSHGTWPAFIGDRFRPENLGLRVTTWSSASKTSSSPLPCLRHRIPKCHTFLESSDPYLSYEISFAAGPVPSYFNH